MSPVTIELRKGRKRRPSNSLEDGDDPVMDDCMAAMVLMSLSCSPKSTFIPDRGIYSVSVKSIDSGVGFSSAASRSNTPSPCTINEEPTTASPVAIEINTSSNHVETIKGNINNDSNVNNNQINGLTIIHKDEGIDMDETIDFIIDDPIQTIAEKARRIVFKCTWRGCGLRCDLVESIERHIRTVHLGRSENASEEENDHEEEFYYAEIEEEMEIDDNISSKDSSSSNDSSLGPLSPVSSSPESPHSTNYNLSPTLSSASSLLFFAPSPTWSHLDMARPPHEDPEYQAQQKQIALQLQLQQQQQQQIHNNTQNQQVQNFNHHHQQPSSSVTQTIISAQFKPEPERKTVISSPINIPGISVAHRWSSKDSSLASNASCNSSYSFSNSHHHHHHRHLNQHIHNNNHHHLHHHHNQSQASFIASSSSPVNFFSPKAPSKVMRLSSNTSSPINIKSSAGNTNSTSNCTMNGKANSTTVTSIISTNNPTMSTNTTTNANNTSSNQWTSLLQSNSTSTSSSNSTNCPSSSSAPAIATTLLKGSSISPTRRTRTETRKCRKVYGMDNRDSWCTQCKWKKACTRFVD